MPAYIVQGFDPRMRRVRERIWASNSRDAITQANRQRITVMEVRLELKSLLHLDISCSRLPAASLALFCRQLSALVGASIPIVRALRTIAGLIEDRTLVRVAGETAVGIEEGHTLTTALERNAHLFPPVMLQTLSAAEGGGNLILSLDLLAGTFEHEAALRRKVIGVLTYPAIVLVMVLAVQAYLLVVMLPRFAEIYSSMSAELPAPTQVLIRTSEWLFAWGWLVPILLVSLVILVRRLLRIHRGLRLAAGHLTLGLPVLGPLHRKSQSARFIRIFAGLVASGTPIVRSLEFASGSLSNPLLVSVVGDAIAQVTSGKSLAPAFRKGNHFPLVMVEMMAVGEEIGDLPGMLLRAAIHCEGEVRTALERLTAMLEPLLIMLLTVAVGLVVVPMLLPVLTLTTQM